MNKKAFTLVELLAVIVVLAIILIIAVPRVMNAIEESRKESLRITGENLIKGAQDRLVFDSFDPQTYKIYTITNGQFVGESIPISGKLPDNGKIYVKSDTYLAIAVEKDNYCAIMQLGEKQLRIETEGDCILNVPGIVPDSCFNYSTFGSDATINGYDSSCSKDVNIPSSINGFKVLKIAHDSFDGLQMTSVEIPSSVENIEWNAFRDNFLTSVILNNGLKEIGAYVFYNNSIKGIILPESLLSIYPEAFANNEILSLKIPNSVTLIEWNAFKNNQISELDIGSGLNFINSWIFANNNLKEIFIPNNINTIREGAFYNDSEETVTKNNITKITIPSDVNVEGYAISLDFYQKYDWVNGKAGGIYTAPSQTGTWTKQ